MFFGLDFFIFVGKGENIFFDLILNLRIKIQIYQEVLIVCY